jgi:hypothetical protein
MVVDVLLPPVASAVGMVGAWWYVRLRVERVADRCARPKNVAEWIFVCGLGVALGRRESSPQVAMGSECLTHLHQINEVVDVISWNFSEACETSDPSAAPITHASPAPHLVLTRAQGDQVALEVWATSSLDELALRVLDRSDHIAMHDAALTSELLPERTQVDIRVVREYSTLRETLGWLGLRDHRRSSSCLGRRRSVRFAASAL